MKIIFKMSAIALLILISFGTGFIVNGGGVYETSYKNAGATLRFVNETGLIVSEAKISVLNKSCSVKSLNPGGEIICYFENLTDSSYSVEVILENDGIYKDLAIGYVTGGMDFNDIIRIDPLGNIELESNHLHKKP